MMVVVHEFNEACREVYLDGRPLPENPESDLERLLHRALGPRYSVIEINGHP
jgi:hypothetical protein